MKKKLSELKHLEGIDCNLEISLAEYGLAWGKNDECESEDEWYFIYAIDSEYTHFDHGYLTKSDYIDMLDSWADVNAISKFCGLQVEEIRNGFPDRVFDLVIYYGHTYVFGESYWEGFEIDWDN